MGAAKRIRAFRELAERFEHLAQHATIADVRDSYLKLAKLYRQRAEAWERRRQQENSSRQRQEQSS